MKFDEKDIQESTRINFMICQDEAEFPASPTEEGIYEMLKSIAISLAVIADHLTKKEMEDPDAMEPDEK